MSDQKLIIGYYRLSMVEKVLKTDKYKTPQINTL